MTSSFCLHVFVFKNRNSSSLYLYLWLRFHILIAFLKASVIDKPTDKLFKNSNLFILVNNSEFKWFTIYHCNLESCNYINIYIIKLFAPIQYLYYKYMLAMLSKRMDRIIWTFLREPMVIGIQGITLFKILFHENAGPSS